MLYKIIPNTITDGHRVTYGGYNSLPPNFKETTVEEFIDGKFF